MTTAKRLALAAALVGFGLPGCTDWAGYDLDVASGKVPQLANMRRSVIPDPYAMPRLPAPGTVPVSNPMGDVPGHFGSAQLDSVAPTLANPYAGGATPAVLARGKVQYDNNCTVCHGPAGAGDGTVVQQARGADGKMYPRFPFAPPVNGAAAAARSDGYLYAVVAAGRGLMPPYGSRITHPDRWAVVEYVRALQARAGQTAQRGAAAPATSAATATTPQQQTEPPAAPTPAPGQPAAQNAPAAAPAAAPVVPAAQGPAAARP
ncbi:MAG TPA: cytochrome c [Longimicrobium sp.]|nr:cytochrome c [Longimicrobium sp.]